MSIFSREKDPKIEAVKKILGNREGYINVTRKHSFTDTEKDILLQASITVGKKTPNKETIKKAFEILSSAGIISADDLLLADTAQYNIYMNKEGGYKARAFKIPCQPHLVT